MSENNLNSHQPFSEEQLSAIEKLDFDGVETEQDNNELFGERLAAFAFHTKGGIGLYNETINNNKINKIFFSIKGLLITLGVASLSHGILSAVLSSNPVNPTSGEVLVSNITFVLLILSIFGYLIFLKKKKKLIIFSVFEHTTKLISFFSDPQQRFNFIQYILHNKNNFITSDDKEFFTKKIKELKILDKNKDPIGFSLLVLFLYDADVVKFFQEVSSNNSLNYAGNKEITLLMNYFNEKMKQAQSTENQE